MLSSQFGAVQSTKCDNSLSSFVKTKKKWGSVVSSNRSQWLGNTDIVTLDFSAIRLAHRFWWKTNIKQIKRPLSLNCSNFPEQTPATYPSNHSINKLLFRSQGCSGYLPQSVLSKSWWPCFYRFMRWNTSLTNHLPDIKYSTRTVGGSVQHDHQRSPLYLLSCFFTNKP